MCVRSSEGGEKLLNYESILMLKPTPPAGGEKGVKDDSKLFSLSNQDIISVQQKYNTPHR